MNDLLQDDVLDCVIDGSRPSTNTAHVALSLRPDDKLSFAAATGHKVAQEIALSWKFNPHNLVVMTSAELDALSADQIHISFVSAESQL